MVETLDAEQGMMQNGDDVFAISYPAIVEVPLLAFSNGLDISDMEGWG